MWHNELPQEAHARDGHPHQASASCTGSPSTEPGTQPLALTERLRMREPALTGNRSQFPSLDSEWKDPARWLALHATKR